MYFFGIYRGFHTTYFLGTRSRSTVGFVITEMFENAEFL